MKTKEEILKAQTAREVFEWIQTQPGKVDVEVAKCFDTLRLEEFKARHPNYDPNMHYEAW